MLITRLFTSEGLLIDQDSDGLPDGCQYRISIDPSLSSRESMAVANLAVRLGIELVGYHHSPFQLYDTEPSSGTTPYLLISHGWNTSPVWNKVDEGLLWIQDSDQITLSGGRGLIDLLTWLACGYPRLGEPMAATLSEVLRRKRIREGSVVGLAVARGRLQAVYVRTRGAARRVGVRHRLWPASGVPATDRAAAQCDIGQKDLVGLFLPSPDRNEEGRPIPIVIDDPCDMGAVLAACHIGLRMGLEHTRVPLPLVVDRRSRLSNGPCFCIQVQGGQGKGAVLGQDGRGGFSLSGDSRSLEMAARYLADHWPHALTQSDRPDPLKQWSNLLDDLGQMKGEPAELAWLLGSAASKRDETIAGIHAHASISEEMRVSLQERSCSPIHVEDRVERDLIEAREFTCPWEVDEMWRVVRTALPAKLAGLGDRPAALQVFISEPVDVRHSLRDEMRTWLNGIGGANVAVQVISAYKPGLSWITDVVAPELIRLQEAGISVQRLRITYQCFGQDGYLELSSRWLQELYPIDELIARQTGLPLDAIEFVPVDEDGARYRVQVIENELVIKEWSLTCHNGDRHYLDRFPNAGRVKTFTSWIALVDGDHTLWAQSFASDLELIWQLYQAKVLPWVEGLLGQDGPLRPQMQPFFREFCIELWASEDDRELGVREERLSPLEAMHEEFYFTTLDWFSRLGAAVCGEPLRKPGAIIPLMRQRKGRGATLRVSIRRTRAPQTEIVFTSGKRLALEPNGSHQQFPLERLDFIPQGSSVVVLPVFGAVANQGLTATLDGLRIMARRGLIELPRIGARVVLLGQEGALAEYRFSGDRWDECACEQSLPRPVSMNVIGYEEMQDEIQTMREHQIGRVSTIARSFGARSIEMVELVSPAARVISRAKLVASRPTYMVIARHHANEVSSSNAALLLARQLAREKRTLLSGVNVVILPMENPDGAALHSRLAAEAPTWKHHAARFNALGEDLAVGYFQDQPTDPASMAVTTAWRAWRPDVVGDNHGVPSHEWEQPFSGYVCPWFATFWMPRALYYGYFAYFDDPTWPEHRRMSEALRWKVSSRLAENRALTELNTIWRDRYLKYAHRPCPEKFLYDEQEFCQGLLSYCSGVNRESKAVTAARRFPDQTVLWWIDEVNDETAQGEYLALCIQTHLDANLAVIKYLASLPVQLEREQRCNRGGAVFIWSRPRPLDVGAATR